MNTWRASFRGKGFGEMTEMDPFTPGARTRFSFSSSAMNRMNFTMSTSWKLNWAFPEALILLADSTRANSSSWGAVWARAPGTTKNRISANSKSFRIIVYSPSKSCGQEHRGLFFLPPRGRE